MSSKKQQENKEKMTSAIGTLQGIADSTITPRNIRKVVKDAVTMLHDEKLTIGVKAANAISILDEVSQDPNMPSFARVTIWSAVSHLEAIRD
tara:strand:+ start:176 stop:451 length:276 start_codon:yes stop_codon:yes gene_type:complete